MGTLRRRISDETAAVLRLFLSEPATERFGLEVGRATNVDSGALYPILIRLEHRGILTSRTAGTTDPVTRGRPRRYYSLTDSGVGDAEGELGRWREAQARRAGRKTMSRRKPVLG